MFQAIRSNLGRRIIFLVMTSMLLVLIGLGISAWLAVRQTSSQIFQERLALAQTTGQYLDYILRQNLERLDNISFASGVNIEDGDYEPEKRALHNTYLGSIFNDGVFITDDRGLILWIEPFRQGFVGTSIAGYVPAVPTSGAIRPSISNVLKSDTNGRQFILMVSPLRNQDGKVVGLVGGQIDPTGRSLPALAQPSQLGQTSFINVIDSQGVVLDSSDQHNILQAGDVNGRSDSSITESVGLTMAPWSVIIGQSESEAMAPVTGMQRRVTLFGISALVLALFLSLGMAWSLVKPIGRLTAAAETIAKGDLSKPVPPLGSDEIGKLGVSFDTMRMALKDSLDEIQSWNRELEVKVEERTRQLEASNREIASKEAAHEELLRKVLTIQEEERKRIARELHDETSQALVGLVMRVDALGNAAVADTGKVRSGLPDIRSLAVRTLDNVHKIIFDLRPSILDDLGLLSAIRWYAGNRLEPLGINTRVEVTGDEKKLTPQVEIALFRVVQEAINNIVKHAEARNVMLGVEFTDRAIAIEVEDDGKGFDLEAVKLTPDKARGIGILGMKERVALLQGELNIESRPDKGTRITARIPL